MPRPRVGAADREYVHHLECFWQVLNEDKIFEIANPVYSSPASTPMMTLVKLHAAEPASWNASSAIAAKLPLYLQL